MRERERERSAFPLGVATFKYHENRRGEAPPANAQDLSVNAPVLGKACGIDCSVLKRCYCMY